MFVSFEKAKERYSICKSCDKFYPGLKMCKNCGCLLPVKVTMASSKCPLSYWDAETESFKDKNYKVEE